MMDKRINRSLHCLNNDVNLQHDNNDERLNSHIHKLKILIISQIKNFAKIKSELEKNDVHIIHIAEPTERLLLTYALQIDMIVTNFDWLEKTMKLVKASNLIHLLFISVIVLS